MLLLQSVEEKGVYAVSSKCLKEVRPTPLPQDSSPSRSRQNTLVAFKCLYYRWTKRGETSLPTLYLMKDLLVRSEDLSAFADVSLHRNQSMAHSRAIMEEKTSPGGNGVAGSRWGELLLSGSRTVVLSSGRRDKTGGAGTWMLRRTEGPGPQLHSYTHA